MAESDTILQLGIEAAREGNRDEARSLFNLLTRQEPENAQAWLWLAGVAETPDERRAALERVVALDPSNEMARKGLAAMGAAPEPSSTAALTSAPPPIVPVDLDDDFGQVPAAPATPAVYGNLSDEERYAAELDGAFDEYDAVEKVGGSIRNVPTSYNDNETIAAGAAAGGAYSASARDRVESRRSARVRPLVEEDNDDERPQRRSPFSSLALGLIGLIVLFLLLSWLWSQFGPESGGTTTGGAATATAQAAGGAGGTATGTSVAAQATPGADAGTLPTDTGVTTDTGVPTDTTTLPVVEPTPAPVAPGGGFPDPATANPAQVAIGTPLEANGLSFTFPNASYAASLGGTIGSQTAQNGRFVVVLLLIGNNTGTAQVVPADAFVLKDAQGRVYTANPAASEAYVIPGVNADFSMEDPLPSNGIAYSTALVFDVAPDATNLVLFNRAKQDQGFLVLNAVP
ncbi:MAG: hypothetical protein H7Z42_06450 [Roseiflexaceae bacterium]|nr:hypothetical protein [Roseiflexaceae bacterium]